MLLYRASDRVKTALSRKECVWGAHLVLIQL